MLTRAEQWEWMTLTIRCRHGVIGGSYIKHVLDSASDYNCLGPEGSLQWGGLQENMMPFKHNNDHSTMPSKRSHSYSNDWNSHRVTLAYQAFSLQLNSGCIKQQRGEVCSQWLVYGDRWLWEPSVSLGCRTPTTDLGMWHIGPLLLI